MVHINGHEASMYYATFPQSYLRTVQKLGLAHLEGTKQIYLHHTKPQSLLHPESRTKFLEDFIAVILFLADGKGNVGLMRREPATPIHRDFEDNEDIFTGPPQQVLDDDEIAALARTDYAF